MAQRTVEINIVDRKLNIACPVGQETALMNAAQELTSRLTKTRANKALNNPEQAMLMTALNLADDLLKAQQQLEIAQNDNQNKIELLQSIIEQSISPLNKKIA